MENKEMEKQETDMQDSDIQKISAILQEFHKMDVQQKVDKYRVLNLLAKKGQILFTGSSLMEQFPINELMMTEMAEMTETAKLPEKLIYNRGIGGFTTQDMLEYLDVQIFDLEPSVIFINIGTNDLNSQGQPLDAVLDTLECNYSKILDQIHTRLPETQVYLMAYYPVNEDAAPEHAKMSMFGNRKNKNMPLINSRVEALARKFGYSYIDVNDGLTDEDGNLKKEYTVDGVHMYADAYKQILENMKPYL